MLRALLPALLLFAAAPRAAAQEPDIGFEDATERLGVVTRGPSFGAGAWGDWDGDGWPDLWLGNHAEPPSLYVNQGDGRFIDFGPLLFPPDRVDSHGAAWADFDGDGDEDLFEAVGAKRGAGDGPNRMWVNEDGALVDRADELGLALADSRARMPVWLDWNGDGRLDLVLVAHPGASGSDVLLTQQPDGRFELELAAGFRPSGDNTRFGVLGDLGGGSAMDVALVARSFPDMALGFDAGGFRSLGGLGLTAPLQPVVDLAMADFDGDADVDVYAARFPYWLLPDAGRAPDGAIRVAQPPGGTTTLRFRCDGDLRFELHRHYPRRGVYLGARRNHPRGMPLRVERDDKEVLGTIGDLAGLPPGLYIGREADAPWWRVDFHAPFQVEMLAEIHSDAPIEWLQIDQQELPEPPDHLMLRGPAGFSRNVFDAGMSGRSVVAADFDNDMDLDLYVVRSGAALNRPNALWLRDGAGFRLVPDAGGASGSLRGVGDAVSAADFDRDGFVDLALTHGDGTEPLHDDAAPQLFRNLGNGHHWLQFDLRGDAANPHGIGARVLVEAGGVVQLREQANGMHRWTQNHRRLHFGLGPHTQADRVVVIWPDGSQQTWTGVPADQIRTLVQASQP